MRQINRCCLGARNRAIATKLRYRAIARREGGEVIPAVVPALAPAPLCTVARTVAALLPTTSGTGVGRIGKFPFRCALNVSEADAASAADVPLPTDPCDLQNHFLGAPEERSGSGAGANGERLSLSPGAGRRGERLGAIPGAPSRFRIRVRVSNVVDVYAPLLHVVVALFLPNGRRRVANSPRACSIQDAAS